MKSCRSFLIRLKGRAGTLTHDYKRHGTITLFAARNTPDGSAIARCEQPGPGCLNRLGKHGGSVL